LFARARVKLQVCGCAGKYSKLQQTLAAQVVDGRVVGKQSFTQCAEYRLDGL
jgi:hypothetical protein